MQKAEPLRRFITGMPKARFEPALGPATLCGLMVETDDASGRAKLIQMIRHGGLLSQSSEIQPE
jgi:calcineurin-like phosphoesterase